MSRLNCVLCCAAHKSCKIIVGSVFVPHEQQYWFIYSHIKTSRLSVIRSIQPKQTGTHHMGQNSIRYTFLFLQ